MSEISEEATNLIDNFEYAVEDAVSDYTMACGASQKHQARRNLEDYIAELEAESERFIVHSDIERQDDKSSNDTQTQTIVYGKESEG